MSERTSQRTLTHEDAVVALNGIVVDVYEARERCHAAIRDLVGDQLRGDGLGDVLDEVDCYASALEAHFSALIAIKLRHPAAWDASEGGRISRACWAAIHAHVSELLGQVFGRGRTDEASADVAEAPADFGGRGATG